MNENWNIQNFIPLITTRDILIIMEVLQFGSKYPNQLIYQNKQRKVFAKEFQNITIHFSHDYFKDLCTIMQPRASLVHEIEEEMLRRMVNEIYLPEEISQGKQYLDMAIMLYCCLYHSDLFKLNDHSIVWNSVQMLQWCFYFAKMLIQFG